MKEKKFDYRKYISQNKFDLGEVESKNFEAGTHVTIENKTILTEGVKYPSQEEAEAILDWTTQTNAIYFAGGGKVKKAFDKADAIRVNLWQEIFGENSPWEVIRKGNKSVVGWSDRKAAKMGL